MKINKDTKGRKWKTEKRNEMIKTRDTTEKAGGKRDKRQKTLTATEEGREIERAKKGNRKEGCERLKSGKVK
jgi:hypothetical protein